MNEQQLKEQLREQVMKYPFLNDLKKLDMISDHMRRQLAIHGKSNISELQDQQILEGVKLALKEFYGDEPEHQQVIEREAQEITPALKPTKMMQENEQGFAKKENEIYKETVKEPVMLGNSFEAVMNQGAEMANMLMFKFVDKQVTIALESALRQQEIFFSNANNSQVKIEGLLERGKRETSGFYAEFYKLGSQNDAIENYQKNRENSKDPLLLAPLLETFDKVYGDSKDSIKELDKGEQIVLSQMRQALQDHRAHLGMASKFSAEIDDYNAILQDVRSKYAEQLGYMEGSMHEWEKSY